MKIKTLHIYGYGQFEDKIFDLTSASFITIYGKNEAGKSTIMSFILSILYGIPSRNHSRERYEPKMGNKYGGKITIQSKNHGEVIIERMEGKSSRELNIYFEDGTKGSESDLIKILQGIEKTIFEGVFYFNLQGLQLLEQLSAEDLSNYLFSTGLIGTDAVNQIEQRLDRQLDTLYKPKGKKPEINIQLEDLEDLQKKIQKEGEKFSLYNELMDEHKRYLTQLQTIERQQQELNNELKMEQLKANIHPFIIEKRVLEEQKKLILEHLPFPEDGVNRLEQIQTAMLPLKAQLNAIIHREKNLLNKIENLEVNNNLLFYEKDFTLLYEERKLYEQKQKEVVSLTERIHAEETNIRFRLLNLGSDWTEERVRKVNINISMKEEIKKFLEEINILKERQRMLSEEVVRKKYEVKEATDSLQKIEQNLLSKEERQQIETLMKEAKNDELKALERTNNLQKLEDSKKAISHLMGEKRRKQFSLLIYFFLFIILDGLFYGMKQQWDYFTITLFVIIAFILLIGFLNHNDFKKRKKQLEIEKKELEKNCSNISVENPTDIFAAKQKFSYDEELRKQFLLETAYKEDKVKSRDEIERQLGKVDENLIHMSNMLQDLCENYHLNTFSAETIIEAIAIIEEIHVKLLNKEMMEKSLFIITEELSAFEETVVQLMDSVKFDMSDKKLNVALDELKNVLDKEKDKLLIVNEAKKELEIVLTDKQNLELQITHFENKLAEIFTFAKVDDEESFRQKAKAWQEHKMIDEGITKLEAQISTLIPEGVSLGDLNNFEDCQVRLNEIEEQLANSKIIEKEIQAKISHILIKIEQLEMEEKYDEMMYDFEMQKSYFYNKVKEWTTLRLAKTILQKTKDYYRLERLPEIILIAQQFFETFTNKSYIKILPPNDSQNFIVERKDGVRFTPNELSQATKEQLYLSLRLALASVISKQEKFPIIIDDSFVNFDEERTKRVLRLLREISATHQILYFTCHRQFLESFQKNEIIELTN